jgi:subtilase family serine protease
MEILEKQKQFIQKFLDNPNKQEVLAWLDKDVTENYAVTLGEMDVNESYDFARKIYNFGAVEVLAVEIDSYPDGENTGKLLIVLPNDIEKRKTLFAWNAHNAKSLGFEAEKDFGQEYIFVMLD